MCMCGESHPGLARAGGALPCTGALKPQTVGLPFFLNGSEPNYVVASRCYDTGIGRRLPLQHQCSQGPCLLSLLPG